MTISCNNDNEVSFTDVTPLNLSDHDKIACVMEINHVKYEYRTMKCQNFKNYDPQELCYEIHNCYEFHNCM